MANSAQLNIEAFRQLEQIRLDGLKNAAERNKWGQFATPAPLAVGLVRFAHSLTSGRPVRFLDPSIGTGSFFSALLEVFPREEIAAAQGVELDPSFAETAKELWEEEGLEVVKGDFTTQPIPDRRFNLIIANPPYVRHHHLTGPDKERLKAKLLRSLSLEISGLAGLYCYFMLLCHDWMDEQGLAVWLIPSEFMDVNYGATIRRYLTERVTLIHLHRFCPTDVQFADALVSSAVVVFKKISPPQEHKAKFSFGNAIETPDEEALIPLETLRRAQKWTQFPQNVAIPEVNELRLGDVFSIKRGLATGSNQFFILSEDDALNWEIPASFLKPILPGPRHLISDIIESSSDGLPIVSPRLFLLDCRQSEKEITTRWPRFHEYLARGREQGIHSAYLSSRRNPWYSQEDRPPAPFVCTYMGRSRNGKPPFRFIWNRSRATAHNVYLMLYPKPQLRNLLNEHPELEKGVFEALRGIAPNSFISEGRVYGGGLHKVEPRELANIPVPLLSERAPSLACSDKQQELFAL
ncbi:MAG TPA: N-6 DNA methylase [Acidobacteriaceae bacterium]|nr:N-6 DNA methylase [Acidobacteriaceae bacterium]